MRSILDTLGKGLPIRQETRIERLIHEPKGWVLRTGGGTSYAHFDDVIVTVPAPQARDLVSECDPELAHALNDIRMLPVWSCSVRFEDVLPEFVLPEDGLIMRAECMGNRPGRAHDETCWIIHMTPAFTETHLYADPAVIAPFILQTFAEASGISLPGVRYLNAHRWRYAFADQPLGRPYLTSGLPGLVAGGDWTLGRRAEHGFESGVAMAKMVLSRVASPV
jgi:predicted NAD/FAD-dependent oxidoreductase